MKAAIQRWLGVTSLNNNITNLSTEIESLAEIQRAQARIVARSIDDLEKQARPLLVALARMIAQKDKYFALDELDPQRRAESDKIGSQVIKRLQAEDAARRKMP